MALIERRRAQLDRKPAATEYRREQPPHRGADDLTGV
jgi:hypothetical protein